MHKNCPTKLQLSNLSRDTSHRDVETWLQNARVGGTTSISRKKDSFILEFDSSAQAQRAKEILAKNTYINGNVCKLNHYREFMAVGEATVVVQGLTPESNFAGIEHAIRQRPGVTEVSFKKRTTKPYAFVSFERLDQANALIKELHGSWLHGDFLRIFVVSDNNNSANSPSISQLSPLPTAESMTAPISIPVSIPSTPPHVSPANSFGAESPNTRRMRSLSLNNNISFDAFLDNISSNFNLLNHPNPSFSSNAPKRPPPLDLNRNPMSQPNLLNQQNSSFQQNAAASLSPLYQNQANLTSPNQAGQPQNPNNRKSRSKSLQKVYIPVAPNSASPNLLLDPAESPDASKNTYSNNAFSNDYNAFTNAFNNAFNNNPPQPTYSNNVPAATYSNNAQNNNKFNSNSNGITPRQPSGFGSSNGTEGLNSTVSPNLLPDPYRPPASAAIPFPGAQASETTYARDFLKKSVSFDSNLNAIAEERSEGLPDPTLEPPLSIAIPSSPKISIGIIPASPVASSPLGSIMVPDSPGRARSRSFSSPNKAKIPSSMGPVKNPSDMFARAPGPAKPLASKVANLLSSIAESGEPLSPQSPTPDDDDKDVSPNVSLLSLNNLHKNNYFTLRLEDLNEEMNSTILYDLFNCVLSEPPSLLSAKAIRGQGFVDFDSQEMAAIALEKLNGKKFMGHVMVISLVRPEDKCVLKVTNLPFSTDEKDLEEHFSDIAGLISANVVRKATGISKGFAFLVFCHFTAAEKAIQEKHGTIVQGRPINIRYHNGNNNPNNPNNPNNRKALAAAAALKGKSPARFLDSPSLYSDTSSTGSTPNTTPSMTPDPIAPQSLQSGFLLPAAPALSGPMISPGSALPNMVVSASNAAPMNGASPNLLSVAGINPIIRAVNNLARGATSGERPDDAARGQVNQEAEAVLAEFNHELNTAIQKLLVNETAHSQRRDRLRVNAHLLESLRTKLAEKKLEQVNDELAHAKQKQQHKTGPTSPPYHILTSPEPASVSAGDADSAGGNAGNVSSELAGPDDAGDRAKYHARQTHALKQASMRKVIEELQDQMKLAKLTQEIEEEKQMLEDQQVQLGVIELISSLGDKIKKVPASLLQDKIKQLEVKVQQKQVIQDDMQKLQELKRFYDIDLDSPTPPRNMSISSWPNDEAVKIDTFQLYFTDDHFSLRCSNIQLTRASIRPRPFSRDATHLAYWIKLASDPKTVKVTKVPMHSKGPDYDKDNCMSDITSQLYASTAAKIFNEKKLGKVIEYVPIQLLCFYQRSPQVYMTIEPAIEGIWKRYNSGNYINSEKNAFVHAFSHFTHDYSQSKIVVMDLQGTRDKNKYTFTDPYVHCVLNDDSFGKTNGGQAGIDEFFRTHICNKICHSLQLSPHHMQPKARPTFQ